VRKLSGFFACFALQQRNEQAPAEEVVAEPNKVKRIFD
jgi:hypothetical protein